MMSRAGGPTRPAAVSQRPVQDTEPSPPPGEASLAPVPSHGAGFRGSGKSSGASIAVQAAAMRPELDAVGKPVPLEAIALPKQPAWNRWPAGTKLDLDGGKQGHFVGVGVKGWPVVDIEGQRPQLRRLDEVRGPKAAPLHPLAGIPANALRRPSPALAAKLNAIVNTAPEGNLPARAYIDALDRRGHATYVVGGALRDAIRSLADPDIRPRDVDLVGTALPKAIRAAVSELEAKGGQDVASPPYVDNFGAVLLSGDLLDITALKAQTSRSKLPKKVKACFGADLAKDAALRDFSFNAVYYDPRNEVIIDPTGRGVEDAKNMTLRLIKSVEDADVSIPLRFIKFRMRGYAPAEGATEQVRAIAERTFAGGSLPPALARVSPRSAVDVASAKAWLTEFRAAMEADGLGEAYDRHIQPRLDEVIERVLARNAS